jgi:hypothetical protein
MIENLEEQSFREVVDFYLELKSTLGTSSCNAFYSHYNLIHDFPTTSEFVTDVEIVARSSLSKNDFHLFETLFINSKVTINYLLNIKTLRWKLISTVLGRAFLKNNLYPINYYTKKRVN